MILPKPLKYGDTIGIYSPSSPATYTSPKRFERAKSYLKQKGFHILEGSLTNQYDYYRSGSIQERADELNDLIRNPNISCIMSTIGGMNSNSLLPYIDYDTFRNNPKIMIGYSDVTALLLGIYAKTGTPTFYGPALVPSFGEFEPFVDDTYKYFSETLLNDQPLPYNIKQPLFWSDEFINWEEKMKEKELRPNNWISVTNGQATGRMIGGNLNTIQGIWGSPYMPPIQEGDILFIEDSSKDAATIERSFSLLKLNGVFDKVSGIILGKHEQFDDCGTNRKPYEILLEVLQNQRIPFLADFDCCHTHPMITMPIGIPIKLDATNKTIHILEKWTV
ncbi:S66 family peptidase [Bacillus toyonensis]|uniref:LD-carboxypeptidase n=1 Tax=Bacillus toyonensis TaxID=155322 RepID=A0AB73R8C7_9BACI|nr:S66 peptidase family protein [Bacillus toyonensis]PEI85693.1 LD-carboxypeptidase [Bacillus toyonensis]PEK06680.1 LD-carboxypeptidase [Bacillus toyonensis]PEL48707.1 LD-carboxypeptidase [Bacillus toyonensis]PFZ73927.1 LD-carboxypeptidase [Bacillus toyonensis]PGA05900.1 LD-carboxypeptidase [Bacillus toyonensis]